MKKQHKYILLLLACLLSRLLSSIYYIEDIDSLRFALAVYDYDVAHLRPHFPAYPVYCFLAKLFYALTHSLALSFSLIGGISIFVIIYSCLQMGTYFVKQNLWQWQVMITFLLFFNPFLWLMSNRYMPDLMGLALMVLAFHYFTYLFHQNPKSEIQNLKSKIRNPKSKIRNPKSEIRNLKRSSFWILVFDIRILFVYWLFVGLLAGTRLSYLPFLLLPSLILLFRFPRTIIPQLFSFGIGILIWLLPLMVDTGWENLLLVATKQTTGHFYEWGGTILSEQHSSFNRLVKFFQTIWADGLGGYWQERHWLTAIWSIFLGIGLFAACRLQIADCRCRIQVVLVMSLVIYGIWVFFYQNIVYKARHILPFIPFVLMWISLGWHWLMRRKRRKKNTLLPSLSSLSVAVSQRSGLYLILFISLILHIAITSILIQQHRQPTAIAQFKDYLIEQGAEQATLYSIPLVHFYMQQHQKVLIEQYMPIHQSLPTPIPSPIVYSTVKLDSIKYGAPQQELVFYHNPYVNRLWSELWVYVY